MTTTPDIPLDYPADYARGLQVVFGPAAVRRYVIDRSLTRADWMADGEHWFGASVGDVRERYSVEDMENLWSMIENQRHEIQAIWMVHTKRAGNYNEALAALKGAA